MTDLMTFKHNTDQMSAILATECQISLEPIQGNSFSPRERGDGGELHIPMTRNAGKKKCRNTEVRAY